METYSKQRIPRQLLCVSRAISSCFHYQTREGLFMVLMFCSMADTSCVAEPSAVTGVLTCRLDSMGVCLPSASC